MQNKIDDNDLDKLVCGGKKISLGIEVTDGKFTIKVYHENDDWLFWGIESDQRSQEQCAKVAAFMSHLRDYESCESWLCYKYFGDNDAEMIALSDFANYEGSFKLISPSYRSKIVQKIVDQVSALFKQLQE